MLLIETVLLFESFNSPSNTDSYAFIASFSNWIGIATSVSSGRSKASSFVTLYATECALSINSFILSQADVL